MDSFLVGAGRKYRVNGKGGADSVTLAIENLPKHRHENGIFNKLAATHDHCTIAGGHNLDHIGNGDGGELNLCSGQRMSETGEDKPFSNLPPYSAVYYLCRIRTISAVQVN